MLDAFYALDNRSANVEYIYPEIVAASEVGEAGVHFVEDRYCSSTVFWPYDTTGNCPSANLGIDRSCPSLAAELCG
eukprot:2245375-Prymnesium_polylepis.1